jgi:hypothetical protein
VFSDLERPEREQFASIEELLAFSADLGPDVAFARRTLLEELEDALDELPDEPREASPVTLLPAPLTLLSR